MGYIETLRGLVGNIPLILVRPSVLIVNDQREVLLVKYRDHTWGVPGGMMELGESVEECARREVREEIGIELKQLQLYGVFSGEQLYTQLKNGDQYYNVVIGYICSQYEGELQPDGIEVFEAKFYNPKTLPDSTDPYLKRIIQENIQELASLL
ncbi:NUDIX domain-containing protein [Paenibacillus barcinonensis]|uniref:NUDIX hydrolase n=1 Tax=Paenibacillus TaxID=44249 RepID=UPI001C123FB2|nr:MULTISPECIES: NUDIX domain-containing protein [Paenibacillus]MBU5352766.1 NUDIX domain-containing protein [Paenibacillus barcinonensis]MDM5281125.1 NUDIX domain-containing protein [Paenibacillus silvae]